MLSERSIRSTKSTGPFPPRGAESGPPGVVRIGPRLIEYCAPARFPNLIERRQLPPHRTIPGVPDVNDSAEQQRGVGTIAGRESFEEGRCFGSQEVGASDREVLPPSADGKKDEGAIERSDGVLLEKSSQKLQVEAAGLGETQFEKLRDGGRSLDRRTIGGN